MFLFSNHCMEDYENPLIYVLFKTILRWFYCCLIFSVFNLDTLRMIPDTCLCQLNSMQIRLISGWMALSINKICVSGQTAIHTYFMSHHCITAKLRFCGVCMLAHYCDWESLPVNINQIFLAPIWWYGQGGHVIPTERHHKPHSECHNQFIGNQVWRTCYLRKW